MSHRKTRVAQHSLPKQTPPLATAPRYPAGLWSALLLLGTVAVVALFAWQVKNLNTNPAPPTGSQPVNGPRLVFEETTFDVGKVPLDRTVERTYVYRNIGSETVVLTEEPTVDVVEGCWPPQPIVSSTTIKPGQSGTLRIATQMHKEMEGRHEFRIVVKSNDPVNPATTLTFKGVFGP